MDRGRLAPVTVDNPGFVLYTNRMKLIRRIGLLVAATFMAHTFAFAAAPDSFKVSEFTFKRPATWKWIESTSSMRAAQLAIEEEKSKEKCEVVFYYFGQGGGGGTKANVDRWLGQFTDSSKPATEESTVGKTKVTYVKVEGTYQSGVPGGPKTPMSDYALLGAIVEGGEGSVFVKLTGPKALTKSSEPDFKKMVEGGLK
jgi:hypothetical protein